MLKFTKKESEFLTAHGPTWYKCMTECEEIEDLYYEYRHKSLNLGLSDRCIVGECRGWISNYHCDQCNECANSFIYSIKYNDTKDFHKALNGFIDHYNEVHKN